MSIRSLAFDSTRTTYVLPSFDMNQTVFVSNKTQWMNETAGTAQRFDLIFLKCPISFRAAVD